MSERIRRDIVPVVGGRVEVWLKDDGLFGVSLLPDEGGDTSFTSVESHDGFPPTYDEKALLAWGVERWGLRLRTE
jgi:hypothetical protein